VKEILEHYKVQIFISVAIFLIILIVYMNTHIVNDLKSEREAYVVSYPVAEVTEKKSDVMQRKQRFIPRYNVKEEERQPVSNERKQTLGEEPSDREVIHQKPLQTLILVN